MIANATDPVQAFYNSSFTDLIVAEFKEKGIFLLKKLKNLICLGGLITKEDFLNYSSILRGDDEVVYTYLKNGRQICGPPPPSGSAVTQAILNILDG